MSYVIEYEQRPKYLYALVTGDNSPQAVASYMRELRAECKRRDCYRVLVDERLEGPRLQADQVFELASEGAAEALGIFQAIAYVDEKMGDMSHFMENVAVNRGMPVRAFPTVAHADEWLSRGAAHLPRRRSRGVSGRVKPRRVRARPGMPR